MVDAGKLKPMANAIRMLSVDAVEAAKSGHPGLPMGAADLVTTLFVHHINVDPAQPDWPNRDRFVLSAGHGSMLLYSLYHLLGYEDFTIDSLKKFRQLGSITAGHPEYPHGRGIETTTGPLGQGLATAVGMALGERILAAEFGEDIVSHRTFVLASDGDLMEGISHEAIALAGHLGLKKLTVIYDDNQISIDGPTSLSDSGDAVKRFEAAGWNAERIDGHDVAAIDAALTRAASSDKPTMIAARTQIGFGSPGKVGTSGVHGSPLGTAEVAATRSELGWDSAPFEVPEEVRDAWRIAGLRAAQSRKDWEQRFEAMDAEARADFERRKRGDLPSDFKPAMAALRAQLKAERPSMATRKASERVLNTVNGVLPETVGGSADLTGSNNTKTDHLSAVSPGQYGGRYIHYGIREHGMAAAMNGMALEGGLIPYSGTFLTFSDYCRPAIRLSALMGLRVVYVMTHDSIGLGEDGPTHQPVEHMAALRAMPGLINFRPCDAVETAEAWELAVERRGPSTLALTRQNLPTLSLSDTGDNRSRRGAYKLRETEDDAMATIFASGSEVEIAVEAANQLNVLGIATEVVSVPCMDLFDEADADYRDTVIGKAPVKVAIEAAVRFGWDSIIGHDGIFIGMKGFGASGPFQELYEHFGITAAHTVAAVRERLGR
ncbi:transketolase [Acuticoccus sp. MNP-M23]|uniref:transketolase n=1 Tax=Acuticoccus sp. MNP-M23 TaxID=3072793 RepID=UPI002814D87A|nr:transketolase [Acuticoccus sp. MNP-M23]WMS43217.1 transketolase [Acuticoccus sp. MNP-M23]